MQDSDRDKFTDIESLENRTALPEIEIKESLRKKKGNIIPLRGEGRAIKVKITNKKY